MPASDLYLHTIYFYIYIYIYIYVYVLIFIKKIYIYIYLFIYLVANRYRREPAVANNNIFTHTDPKHDACAAASATCWR